jgi:hypothetical protein
MTYSFAAEFVCIAAAARCASSSDGNRFESCITRLIDVAALGS